MPKVSIIIPVYGVEKYIERCSRSLFEQTLDDLEYLFIDDCTPDKSIDVLKNILEEYPNRKIRSLFIVWIKILVKLLFVDGGCSMLQASMLLIVTRMIG